MQGREGTRCIAEHILMQGREGTRCIAEHILMQGREYREDMHCVRQPVGVTSDAA